MKTIEAIRELFAKSAAAKDSSQKELKALEQKLESQEKAANAALDNGDAEQLLKIEDEQKLTRAKIRVLQHKLSALDIPCTQEEMQAAWKTYVQTYQKDLAKAEVVFAKHRKDLCDEYRKYVEIQNEALKIREEFGELLGIDIQKVENLFRMPYIETDNGIINAERPNDLSYGRYMLSHPEPLYFRAVNDITDDELDSMDEILRMHKHKE